MELKENDIVVINPAYKSKFTPNWYNEWVGRPMTIYKIYHKDLLEPYIRVHVKENHGSWSIKYLMPYEPEEFLKEEDFKI